MNPTTVVTILQAIPIVASVVKEGLSMIDDWGCPQKRNEALIDITNKNERSHKEAMAEINKDKKALEEKFHSRAEAAKKRAEEQKLENDKLIREREAESNEQNKRHEESIKKLNEEYEKKMNELKSESKVDRENAEKEHKELMSKIAKEHDEENRKYEIELAEMKKEAKIKTEQEEAEIKRIEEEKDIQFKQLMEKEKQAETEHLNGKTVLNQIIRQLKLENEKIERQHVSEEHKLVLSQIEKNYNELLDHIDEKNTKAIVMKFRRFLEPFSSLQVSLEKINASCIGIDGSPASFLTLSVDLYTNKIVQQAGLYDHCVKEYNQHLLNTKTTNRKLLDYCSKLIQKMSDLMKSKDIVAIYTKLPQSIKEEKVKEVKAYAKMAGDYSKKFTEVNKELEKGIQKFTIEFAQDRNPRKAIGM